MPADGGAGRIFAHERLAKFLGPVRGDGRGAMPQRNQKFGEGRRRTELERLELVALSEVGGAPFGRDSAHDNGAELELGDRGGQFPLFVRRNEIRPIKKALRKLVVLRDQFELGHRG